MGQYVTNPSTGKVYWQNDDGSFGPEIVMDNGMSNLVSGPATNQNGYTVAGLNNINEQNTSLGMQDWFKTSGNILSALTGLGSYLNGRKALKLAKDQFNMQRNTYLDNRNTQANLINQSLQDRLNTRYLQNTGSTNGANEEYERRKLSMLNSI